MSFINGIFNNDSKLGQLMTRVGIMVGANLLFVLFSLPVITIGPAWAALHYTMLRTLREKDISLFKVFFRGFKENFKQGLLAELIFGGIAGILVLELFWCSQFEGPVRWTACGLVMLLTVVIILAVYIFPVMAALNGKITEHLRSSLYFAVKNILNMLVIVFISIVPMALTYLDSKRMPLYAFIWFFIGFSAVAIFTDSRLLPMFSTYLEPIDAEEDDHENKGEKELLADMAKLGM